MSGEWHQGVDALPYTTSHAHYLLAEGADRPEGPNIGRQGEHLTIVAITMNRPPMVHRLLDSIAKHMPHFVGDVLVVDNGSDEAARLQLAAYLARAPVNVRYVAMPTSLGVAAGRNAAVRHVRTDWMLMLDDDIYLVSNPLSAMQEDIATLGCKFANAKILNPDLQTPFAWGGHLFVTSDRAGVNLNHGSPHQSAVVDNRAWRPEIGTFLFGTGAVMERQAFLQMGGFDEQLCVGFEDIDFSLRLFREGLKVGSIGPFSFVHDDPAPAGATDGSDRQIRYSEQTIKDAALHLEEKYGFGVWTGSPDRTPDARPATAPETPAAPVVPHNWHPGVEVVPYTTSHSHFLLAAGADRPEGPNIGRRGEHLTIVTVTMNRPEVVRRLVESVASHIPHFRGEVLIVDNGSDEQSRLSLQANLSTSPVNIRFLALPTNLGVAAGRNQAVGHVRTEWMLLLDDDIYLTGDPLAQLQEDVAVLGCRFASLRLLDADAKTPFAWGGHLYLTRAGDAVRMGHGSSHRGVDPGAGALKPELGTFLFGGASLMERAAFEQVGGFDEQLFIGFEDTDFSIRLFQRGMKVGSVGPFAFVHDHPKPISVSNESYERTRYSRQAIKDAALHMESKHAVSFWHEGLQRWLDEKNGDLPMKEPLRAVPSEVRRRPKVALFIDKEGWAYGNLADQLRRELSHRFEFTILSYDALKDDFRSFLALEGFDVVYFFWRVIFSHLLRPPASRRAATLGLDFRSLYAAQFERTALTFGVYDHLFLGPEELAKNMTFFNQADLYSVSSRKLFDIYSRIPGCPRPGAELPDGVDLRLFRPSSRSRLGTTAPLVVGWAGNSAWGGRELDRKGLHSIIRPALRELAKEGIVFKEHFADILVFRRTLEEMPGYYGELDVYLCASESEGTPNPVLEAMASGVPVVTTDVGIVREAFGPLQAEFVLKERSVAALVSALRRLHHDRSLLSRMSKENLLRIRAWDWSKRALPFGDFFDAAMARRRSHPIDRSSF
ncbi:MAG: glycosyltransferase [Devosia nanyangense]|uniref:Glycosyltransferase n=1 Tax=Devosia nanyangense TaxID=1228055 RepID=A0A933KYQ9_9HYPH|nr:glycosyltransferase [Devosia nanyangense]